MLQGVLFLLQFNNFDWNMGLLLELNALTRATCSWYAS